RDRWRRSRSPRRCTRHYRPAPGLSTAGPPERRWSAPPLSPPATPRLLPLPGETARRPYGTPFASGRVKPARLLLLLAREPARKIGSAPPGGLRQVGALALVREPADQHAQEHRGPETPKAV